MSELSYVCGRADSPLLYRTVGDVLRDAAQQWPDRDALVIRQQNVRLTYGALDVEVERLARALASLGLQRGDRVGIWSPNNLEWVLTQFATARAGLILVNINPAYRPVELDYTLRCARCRVLVLARSFKSSDYLAMVRSLLPGTELRGGGRVRSETYPALEYVIQLGAAAEEDFLSFGELRHAGAAADPAPLAAVAHGLDPDQPINVQFTSGTTGLPKGATLSHFNIVNNGFFVGEGMRLDSRDRICIPVPLYHCFGI